MKGVVYRITNLTTFKFYIGSSVNYSDAAKATKARGNYLHTKAVLAYRNGKFLGDFPSLRVCASFLGFKSSAMINHYLKGKVKSAIYGEYTFKYKEVT